MAGRGIAAAMLIAAQVAGISPLAARDAGLPTPECIRAIESVYFAHRDWPADNAAPRPAFAAVAGDRVIRDRLARIRDRETLLEQYWDERVTTRQVQAELERMAASSQAPDILADLFAVLDHDPARIGACLVRPVLVERRLQTLYAEQPPPGVDSDQPYAQWWRQARETLGPGPSGNAPSTDSGDSAMSLPAIRSSAPAGEEPDLSGWMATARLPEGRRNHVSVWTGSEVLLWTGTGLSQGARYDPATDTWQAMTINGEPDPHRRYAAAVWTGTEMVVWGGWGFASASDTLATGGAYDPVTDQWRPLNDDGAPSPRAHHTAVWTGERVLVWGGCADFSCGTPLGTGAAYDPAADAWTPIQDAGAPGSRGIHTAVWADGEMLVWGGCESFTCPDPYGDGGRYDPDSDSWSPISTVDAPEGRYHHATVWSGEEMLVWGGQGVFGFGMVATGGRYNPALDAWVPMTLDGAPDARRFHTGIWAETTGEMVVWGGCVDAQCSQSRATGGRYRPDLDTWTATSTAGAAQGRSHHTAVWTGTEMFVWGGCGGGECQLSRVSGGRYDPAANAWQLTLDPGQPGARIDHTAVWTGAEMIVYGGYEAGQGFTLTGRHYDPATDVWTPLPISGISGQRSGHTAVWTGSRMLVWGGRMTSIGTSSSGAVYDPVAGTWEDMPTDDAPAARAYHRAAWTGTEMVVFGGCAFSDCNALLADGGAFDPATGQWRMMSTQDQPTGRFGHTLDWTGEDILVFGGIDTNDNPLGDGGAWNVQQDLWQALPTPDAPGPRTDHSSVWTGNDLLIWGGRDAFGPLADGASLDPAAGIWTPLPAAGAPSARHGHTAVWNGRAMIVWSGCIAPACDGFNPQDLTDSGGIFDPAGAGSWTATPSMSAPYGRTNHTAVWTGDRMVVWGGWRGYVPTSTGGILGAGTGAETIFREGFEPGG